MFIIFTWISITVVLWVVLGDPSMFCVCFMCYMIVLLCGFSGHTLYSTSLIVLLMRILHAGTSLFCQHVEVNRLPLENNVNYLQQHPQLPQRCTHDVQGCLVNIRTLVTSKPLDKHVITLTVVGSSLETYNFANSGCWPSVLLRWYCNPLFASAAETLLSPWASPGRKHKQCYSLGRKDLIDWLYKSWLKRPDHDPILCIHLRILVV